MTDNKYPPRLQAGIELIKGEVSRLTDSSGVYRMLNEKGDVLYVGKAKSLKKRVANYTQPLRMPHRIQRMVSETMKMEFILTRTEVEALLLEANLIKTLNPIYNILLKDDKSYPYIHLSNTLGFPKALRFRGKPDKEGEYFGPFASGYAVYETLETIQRVFQLRNCKDTDFQTRKTPCLQYHIKRCTAPCVGKVSVEEYAQQVRDTQDFLTGKSREVQSRIQDKMERASQSQAYEQAAFYRDRIKILTSIQSRQGIDGYAVGDADMIALVKDKGQICIQIFFFRNGQSYGNRSFFPNHTEDILEAEIMTGLIGQFYPGKHIPPEILVNEMPHEESLLSEALGQLSGRKISIIVPQRGKRKDIMDMVITNAREALQRHLMQKQNDDEALEKITELFEMNKPPERIEIYDNSHTGGTNMVGAMVVAGPEGFIKKAYRKFNIKTAKAGDDFGMMREVMQRRFRKLTENETLPDLLLIDGGQGQFGVVREELEVLGIFDKMTVVGISKGEDRNAGREKFHMAGREVFQLPLHDPTLQYLQRLRDEAHRFAIGTHRIKRNKSLEISVLDDIPAIGPARKKALLHHFGSAKAVQDASIEDLSKVVGISKDLAEKIYGFFHSGSI
jgi:excinuclease ABC subunit C